MFNCNEFALTQEIQREARYCISNICIYARYQFLFFKKMFDEVTVIKGKIFSFWEFI